MSRIFGLIGLALLAMVPVGAAPAREMTLARDGKTEYVIVQAADAVEAEKTAVRELAEHLEKITGASFPVVDEAKAPAQRRIVVGPGALSRKLLGAALVDGLGPEDLLVRAVGSDLILVGGRPRGTLYAVYSFLEEDLGCRWLTWWGDEIIPRKESLSVPAPDRREAPAMAVRDIVTHTNGYADKATLMRFLARNRGQGPELNFTGDPSPYGGTSHRYGLPPNGWFVHTLFHWIPPERYFEEHPEYYSLIGGKPTKGQLCFTDPGLRKTLTESILQAVEKYGGVGTFSVSAQDTTGPFCQCPKCAALIQGEGTPGAPLFDYLVEAGPLVKAKYPKAFLSTLAYRREQTEIPPRTLRMPDNVIIIFAPIDDNFAQPIEHPSNAKTLENLRGWAGKTDHLWVWYYPYPYSYALPIGNVQKTASDFRLFKRLRMEGYFLEHDAPGTYDGQRLGDLQAWVMLKLMWNPDQDLDRLVRDFTDCYYGAAAPLIREHLAALEKAKDAMATSMVWNASPGQYRFLTPELLVAAQALLDRAEKAVAADPARQMRVRQVRLGVDYACVLLWEGVAPLLQAGPTRAQILDRYEETYRKGIEARVAPEKRARLLKRVVEFVGWRRAMTPLKPLPPPLDGIPAERLRQFTPEGAALHGGGSKIVADPEAAAGIAATMETDGKVPFNTGFYDAVTRRQQHLYPGKDEPVQADRYHLYPVGRTRLNQACYVWFDWSWRIQFPDVAALYDPEHPEKAWDVYVSIRFEGPAYGSTDPALKANRFSVDRVVLVEVAP